MNYLRHLNGFFERLDTDERLSSYHISLYLALFRQWNASRFRDQFVISRAETMPLARIGSANTYARCMKELAEWSYIRYNPSSNLHCGSTVSFVTFGAEYQAAAGAESDVRKPGENAGNASEATTGIPGGIKSDTGVDTGTDSAADTGISGCTENDTAYNTAEDTGIRPETACDTGNDTTTDTGTPGDIENITARDSAADTGTASGRKTDTGNEENKRRNSVDGSKSVTGTGTASDTLFINNTNKNKQEENQKRESSEKDGEKREEKQTDKKQQAETKRNDQTPDFSEVGLFFSQNGFPESESREFYCRYQSAGWKTGNNQTIVSWQALARKWMINYQKNKSHERTFNQVGAGRFAVPTDKDYSEPL